MPAVAVFQGSQLTGLRDADRRLSITTGDRWKKIDRILRLERRLERLCQELDILAVDQKMDVGKQLPLPGQEVLAQCREGIDDHLEQFSRGGILAQVEEDGLFTGNGAKRGEEIDLHVSLVAVQSGRSR